MNPIIFIKKYGINGVIRKVRNSALSRLYISNNASAGYIGARETIHKAKKLRLSICDYVEYCWDEKGVTTSIINKMNQNGVFSHAHKICEIGPGTGRFLEKTLEISNCSEYVFYETAEDWSKYLETNYSVTRRKVDGLTLKHESDFSCDLVHAHGVFTTIHFLHSFSYLKEMIRVVKKNGYVVFDFFCEESMSGKNLDHWLSQLQWLPGGILPSKTIKDLFGNNGFILVDEFDRKYGASFSRYHVYKRS